MKLLYKLQMHLSTNSDNLYWQDTTLKSYDLYLLSPKEAVSNLSMNLNSSLLNCCGDTFLTTEMLNVSNENVKFIDTKEK